MNFLAEFISKYCAVSGEQITLFGNARWNVLNDKGDEINNICDLLLSSSTDKPDANSGEIVNIGRCEMEGNCFAENRFESELL